MIRTITSDRFRGVGRENHRDGRESSRGAHREPAAALQPTRGGRDAAHRRRDHPVPVRVAKDHHSAPDIRVRDQITRVEASACAGGSALRSVIAQPSCDMVNVRQVRRQPLEAYPIQAAILKSCRRPAAVTSRSLSVGERQLGPFWVILDAQQGATHAIRSEDARRGSCRSQERAAF